ncbi:hypothetical protein ANO14919_090460 [Xylariales sp. No.14919]|nr:hypothetical protein ANO14919_090460 [Xylariales sp. No.14919]
MRWSWYGVVDGGSIIADLVKPPRPLGDDGLGGLKLSDCLAGVMGELVVAFESEFT